LDAELPRDGGGAAAGSDEIIVSTSSVFLVLECRAVASGISVSTSSLDNVAPQAAQNRARDGTSEPQELHQAMEDVPQSGKSLGKFT